MKRLFKDPFFVVSICAILQMLVGAFISNHVIICGCFIITFAWLGKGITILLDIRHQQLLTLVELCTIEEELKNYCHRDAKLMEAMNRDHDQIIADIIHRRINKLRKNIF